MVLTDKRIYPQLELDSSSPHSFAVRLFFDEIKDFSLYWLAVEELELRYPDGLINRDLIYQQAGNTIEILEKGTCINVAQIRFTPV